MSYFKQDFIHIEHRQFQHQHHNYSFVRHFILGIGCTGTTLKTSH